MYDVIVIGAGHAGIEAGLACARMHCKTLVLTLNAKTIGLMSCNPAIGGVGKGQLVKEVDALGGQMGKAADACGIQFRVLNASKGPAVQSSRAQIDMYLYNQYMIDVFNRQENIFVKEAQVKKLIVHDGTVKGVATDNGEEIFAGCVVISTGTFLDGLIHVGLKHHSGGRINEPASTGLADDLKEHGLTLMRFKTGTCARLDRDSIDFSKAIVQEGDQPPQAFSFSTKRIAQKQVSCHITYTNKQTHKIIRDNLSSSPLYAGLIKATGVRYCPSIEDKVVKFSEKERHQVFLEPQGLNTNEIYPNGLSTSLPEEVQLEFLRSIEGLENVKVLRFGYGIEHTVVDSTQLFPTLESKPVKNLFFAGQINGTTGYEEAAAQGLVAGINAALRVKNKEPLVLDRASSYIGVLIDDLTTKGTNEPYRMFTSRVEYRLLLREDNADTRLGKIGRDVGLLSKANFHRVEEKSRAIKNGIALLKKIRVKPEIPVNAQLKCLRASVIRQQVSAEGLLKRPQVTLQALKSICGKELDIPNFALREVEIDVKYAGFIQRQVKDVEKFKNLEKIRIPPDFNYSIVPSLSREIREKLEKFKPLNLGQASRISGVTPVAISVLMVYLRKH